MVVFDLKPVWKFNFIELSVHFWISLHLNSLCGEPQFRLWFNRIFEFVAIKPVDDALLYENLMVLITQLWLKSAVFEDQWRVKMVILCRNSWLSLISPCNVRHFRLWAFPLSISTLFYSQYIIFIYATYNNFYICSTQWRVHWEEGFSKWFHFEARSSFEIKKVFFIPEFCEWKNYSQK